MSTAKTIYQIPGPRGSTGTAGTSGTDGVNAFTTTTAQFTMPAETASVTVAVNDSTWAAAGQVVYVNGAGHFEVASKPSATQLSLTNLEVTATSMYADNVAPGTVVALGKRVAPAGKQGPAGAAGTSGANASGYYVVTRATSAPANAVNVGIASDGTYVLKNTVSSNVGTVSNLTLSAFAETILNDVDAAAVRSTIGLGTMATQAAGTVAITGGTIVGITDLAIADGGTGASTEAGARTALGLGTIATQAANAVAITGGSVVGITDITIADGGTGSSTEAGARTNLQLPYTTANLIIVEERQTAGTDAGTFTAGDWRTRTLNTEVVDTGGHSSVGSNQITLAAGTYRCRGYAIAHEVNNHKCRLRNVTDGATLCVGSSVESAAADDTGNASTFEGRFTIAGSKLIELQHRCETTKSTDGMGEAYDFGETEVYAQVVLEREAG